MRPLQGRIDSSPDTQGGCANLGCRMKLHWSLTECQPSLTPNLLSTHRAYYDESHRCVTVSVQLPRRPDPRAGRWSGVIAGEEGLACGADRCWTGWRAAGRPALPDSAAGAWKFCPAFRLRAAGRSPDWTDDDAAAGCWRRCRTPWERAVCGRCCCTWAGAAACCRCSARAGRCSRVGCATGVVAGRSIRRGVRAVTDCAGVLGAAVGDPARAPGSGRDVRCAGVVRLVPRSAAAWESGGFGKGCKLERAGLALWPADRAFPEATGSPSGCGRLTRPVSPPRRPALETTGVWLSPRGARAEGRRCGTLPARRTDCAWSR